jgi:ABC-2 type transport system permease protein
MLRAVASSAFCSILIVIFYATNIFTIGWMFVPFAFSLIASGWAIGFIGAGFIIYYGNKVQGMPWMLPWFIVPFSAVYYPLDALPVWMKYIGLSLPTSYIFEGMRSILFLHHIPWKTLATSLGLNILYLTGAITFFVFMFKKSKEKGLARL